MDDASFTAAHPNNTMVLAGPARLPTGNAAGSSFADVMLPVGMVAQMGVSCSKPLQPMQAVGSGRTFFLTGKGQVSFNIGRLWVNGRNLLRVLYTNAKQANIDFSKFGDSPASYGGTNDEKAWLNLDSELFYIPFGLAVIFRSVAQDTVGAFYIELCMLNSWNTSFGAGQNMIMENVSGMADRLKPIFGAELKTTVAHNDSSVMAAAMEAGGVPNSNIQLDLDLLKTK
jgi:hypothetical protein